MKIYQYRIILLLIFIFINSYKRSFANEELLCSPSTTEARDCRAEREDFILIRRAVKMITCDTDGLSFSSSSCTIRECVEGYRIEDNACLPQFPLLGTPLIKTCSVDELERGNALEGEQFYYYTNDQEYLSYSACVFSKCLDNYDLVGNRCLQVECDLSSYVDETISCEREMDGIIASQFGEEPAAVKTISCDPILSIKKYSQCIVEDPNSCLKTYYYNSQKKICLPTFCNSDREISCIDEKPFASMARRNLICRSDGTFELDILQPCQIYQSNGYVSCMSGSGYDPVTQNCLPLPVCPKNYIEINANIEFNTESFCISKYEEKDSVTGIPLTGMSANTAFDKCAAKDRSGYFGKFQLITNAEWMTMAREIEMTSSNWSQSLVGSGFLSRGWAAHLAFDQYSIPSAWTSYSLPASVSLSDCEYHSSNGCAGQDDIFYHLYKRTHELSNGELIWDIGGSVFEVVDWKGSDFYFTRGPTTCGPALEPLIFDSSNAAVDEEYFQQFFYYNSCLQKEEYLPFGNYNTNHEVGAWRGFKHNMTFEHGVVVRGGGLTTHSNINFFSSGIYALDILAVTSEDSLPVQVGYRCVYHFP